MADPTSVSIRQLGVAELGRISQIDCSNTISSLYQCAQSAGALGLTLRKRPVDPPVIKAEWGIQERESRYRLWRQNIEQDGCIMHGAFRGDHLVGIVLTGRLSDGVTAEVFTLHVHRPERGGGIGGQLMDEAELQAARWGCTQVLVYTGNDCGAVGFYLGRGYRVVGIQDPCVATKNFPVTLLRILHEGPQQQEPQCAT